MAFLFAPSSMPKRLSILLLPLLVLLATSCQEFDNPFYEPVFVLSLHEFENPMLAKSKLVTHVQDTNLHHERSIRRFPFLDARHCPEAKMYGPAQNGLYGIHLHVSPWQVHAMQQIAGNNAGLIYAVAVDGMYVGYSHFTREMIVGDVCTIEPIWTEQQARNIVEHVHRNFRSLNDWKHK